MIVKTSSSCSFSTHSTQTLLVTRYRKCIVRRIFILNWIDLAYIFWVNTVSMPSFLPNLPLMMLLCFHIAMHWESLLIDDLFQLFFIHYVASSQSEQPLNNNVKCLSSAIPMFGWRAKVKDSFLLAINKWSFVFGYRFSTKLFFRVANKL